MKEYRIETVQLGCRMELAESENSSSFLKNMRDFFMPQDDAYTAGHIITEHAEMLMQSMNREGWEVVSTAAVGAYPDNVVLLITFAREMRITQRMNTGDEL